MNWPPPDFGETQRNATDALISIGEPAVEPLIAALKNTDWQLRRNAAMVLGEIKFTPQASVIRIAPPPVQDPRAVARLLAGLKERDNAVIVGACRFFIGRGESGSEDALIQALHAKGDREMAEVFLNCGNSALEEAASQWSTKRGYNITTRRGGSTLQWAANGRHWGRFLSDMCASPANPAAWSHEAE